MKRPAQSRRKTETENRPPFPLPDGVCAELKREAAKAGFDEMDLVKLFIASGLDALRRGEDVTARARWGKSGNSKWPAMPGDDPAARNADGLPGAFAALCVAWDKLRESMPRESVRVLTERHRDKLPAHLVIALRWLGDVSGLQFDFHTWAKLERLAANAGEAVIPYMASVFVQHATLGDWPDGELKPRHPYRAPRASLTLSDESLAEAERRARRGSDESKWSYISTVVDLHLRKVETGIDLAAHDGYFAKALTRRAERLGLSLKDYLDEVLYRLARLKGDSKPVKEPQAEKKPKRVA